MCISTPAINPCILTQRWITCRDTFSHLYVHSSLKILVENTGCVMRFLLHFTVAYINMRCFFIFGWLCCELFFSLRKMLIDPKAFAHIKTYNFNPLTNIGQPWLFILTIAAVVYVSCENNRFAGFNKSKPLCMQWLLYRYLRYSLFYGLSCCSENFSWK